MGLLLVTAILFILSHKSGLLWLSDLSKGLPIFRSWRLVTVYGLIALSAFASLLFAKVKKCLVSYEFLALLVLIVLSAAIPFLPFQQLSLGNSYYDESLTGKGLLAAMFLNVLLFGEILGIIFSGYLRKEVWRINAGAVLLFIFICVKYFDWFFKFLDKSVFFISAGILLFAVGYFMERGRRLIVTEVKKDGGKKE